MGMPKKKLVTKLKRPGLTWDYSQQLRGTETTLRDGEWMCVCAPVHDGGEMGGTSPSALSVKGIHPKNLIPPTHRSWGAARWIHYSPYSPPSQQRGVGMDTVVAKWMQENVTNEKTLAERHAGKYILCIYTLYIIYITYIITYIIIYNIYNM